MHLPRKINTQILTLTAVILCTTLILQVGLHIFMQRENSNAVSSFLNSVLQNTVTQIEELNAEISEISFQLATQDSIQSVIYKYTPPEVIRNMEQTRKHLSDCLNQNRNIVFLGVYKDTNLFMSSKTVDLDAYAYELAGEFSENRLIHSGFYPSFVHDEHTYFVYVTPIIPTDFSLNTGTSSDDCIVCFYRIDNISFGAYNFIDNNSFQLMITDKEKQIQFSSDTQKHGSTFNPASMKGLLHKTTQIENPEWQVTIYHSGSHIDRAFGWSPLYLLCMLITAIAMLVIMFLFLNKIFIKKILILKEKVKKIPTQDITYRIQYKYDDELKEIATIFNQILEKLHALNSEKLNSLHTLHKAQLMQKETQMLLMHSQVSPHFLYNSMSHIQGVAFEYNATEIVQMTSALSKVFRYYSSGGTHSTIEQDLNCAIEYFNGINLRRKNKIALTNIVSRELLKIRCPKMIYQPVLENTLKHAFNIEESGSVIISSVPDDEKAIIEITDNGCGIAEATLSNINRLLSTCDTARLSENYDHVGLLNVHVRLKLYYNEDCGVEITSSSAGTSVRIIIDKDPQKFKAEDIYLTE